MKKTIAVVVDGLLELEPVRLQELKIYVVPRAVKVGRKKWVLDSEATAVSVCEQIAKPGSVKLLPPAVDSYKQVYEKALATADTLLSFHLPPRLDPATAQARLARNLLWPADIRIIELPLPGVGLAKVVEIIAELARQDWDLTMLLDAIEQLKMLTHVYFIVPASAMAKEKLDARLADSDGGWRHIWQKTAVLGLVEPQQCRMQIQTKAADLETLAQQVAAWAPHLFDAPLSPHAQWRPLRYEKQQAGFQTALTSTSLSNEMLPHWSPLLLSWLGNRFIEICLAPTSNDMLASVEQNQRTLVAARRAAARHETLSDQAQSQKPKRLSDYRVRLK